LAEPAIRTLPEEEQSLARRIAAEGVGSFFLFACVIGSGIMAQQLARGNDAVALLGNTLATGAILFVLITMLGPISGAHMNPAVSLVSASRGDLRWRDGFAYIVAQLAFGILGAWAAHLMFDLPTLQLSAKARGWPMDWGSHRDLRPDPDNIRHGEASPAMGSCQRRPLHYRGLLVHLVDQLREPCHHRRTKSVGYLRRDRSARRAFIHRRAAYRCDACSRNREMALPHEALMFALGRKQTLP
jgi:hypothetical protein